MKCEKCGNEIKALDPTLPTKWWDYTVYPPKEVYFCSQRCLNLYNYGHE